jgi:hypothetical protein
MLWWRANRASNKASTTTASRSGPGAPPSIVFRPRTGTFPSQATDHEKTARNNRYDNAPYTNIQKRCMAISTDGTRADPADHPFGNQCRTDAYR